MRIGLVILPEHRWAEAAPRWRAAQEWGFAHAWTYDHLGWRTLLDGPWFDVVTTLTAAASVTTTIPLGTYVISPNFRHPVTLARQLLGIDDVSGGRLLVGVGAGGGGGYDGSVLGQAQLTPGELVSRLGEFVELTDLLLRQPVTSYAGRWYTAVQARSHPGPVQRPRPPLIVAATGPRAMGVAARLGDGWLTNGPRLGEGGTVSEWWAELTDMCRRFEDLTAGRDVARYLNVDAAPLFSLSSWDFFEEQVGRAEQLGFTDVQVHWPRPDGVYAGDPRLLDRVAGTLLSPRAEP